MGLEGRLHLEWISSAEAQKFARVITDFTEKIRMLGPNPLSEYSGFVKAEGLEVAADVGKNKPPDKRMGRVHNLTIRHLTEPAEYSEKNQKNSLISAGIARGKEDA